MCDHRIVYDVLANGPRWFNPHFRNGGLFMPLEFSVAAFRFGHSMIRPRYRLNGSRTDESIMSLLEPARNLLTNQRFLDPAFVVEWSNFFGSSAQPARRIDARLSEGLFTLGFEGDPARAVLNQLAQRNLLRSVVLSIPTGQAVAEAMGIEPLTRRELLEEQPPAVARAFARGRLGCRTPLWYYVLQEAKIHTHGQSLGAVGSRIVAEVLIGLLKADPNSILNCCAVGPSQAPKGVDTGCGVVATFEDLVAAAAPKRT